MKEFPRVKTLKADKFTYIETLSSSQGTSGEMSPKYFSTNLKKIIIIIISVRQSHRII